MINVDLRMSKHALYFHQKIINIMRVSVWVDFTQSGARLTIVKNKSNYLRLGMRCDFHGMAAWEALTSYLFTWETRKNYDTCLKVQRESLERVQWCGMLEPYLSPHNNFSGFSFSSRYRVCKLFVCSVRWMKETFNT